MHGLSSIVASRFRPQVKAQELRIPNQWGDHSRGTHQLPPSTPYFNPLHQPKTPVFTKKLSPKVLFFPHCPKFWKLFTQRPQIGRKKGTQMPLFLWLLSLKEPQFFALHVSVWGECCSLKHGQKLENFVFLRQNRAIWWILLGANLIKVKKTKFQFYRLNRPNCYGRTSLEGRDDTQVIIPWSNTEGDILQPSSVWYCTSWFSKQMPSATNLKLCEQRHFKCKVQCRAANVRFWPENLLQEQDLGYRFLAALFNIFMLVMILISIYSVKVHAG